MGGRSGIRANDGTNLRRGLDRNIKRDDWRWPPWAEQPLAFTFNLWKYIRWFQEQRIVVVLAASALRAHSTDMPSPIHIHNTAPIN